MLDRRSSAAIGPVELEDFANHKFFEVISDAGEAPDGAYHFICIDRDNLLRTRKSGWGRRRLFHCTGYVRVRGSPIEILVQELNFSFIGPTLVRKSMPPIPETEIKDNGARLFTDPDRNLGGYFQIGKRVSPEGELLFTKRSR